VIDRAEASRGSGRAEVSSERHEARVARLGPAPAPSIGVPSSLSIQGWVKTGAGVGLKGARVCVAEQFTRCCEELQCVASDAAGAFRLDTASGGVPTLFASAVGYQSLARTLGSGARDEPLLLTLRAGGASVGGSVADASGGPIASALVTAERDDGQVTALALSDEAGSFRMQLGPERARVRVRADGYSEQVREIHAPIEGLEFTLAGASSIVGRVVAEGTGAPVGDVTVRAIAHTGPSPTRVVRSEGDGSFRLENVAAGSYSLLAVGPHWRTAESHWVSLGVAQITDPVELRVREASPLRGWVRVDGAACAEGFVGLTGPIEGYAALDAEGSAQFDGAPPGRYAVRVGCKGALEQTEQLDVGQAAVARVWDLKRGLQVTGVVLRGAGVPVAGAAVDVMSEASDRGNVRCVTDEHGEFACAGLAPGTYDCTLGGGARAQETIRVAVSDGATPRVVLRQQAAGQIRVRLENASHYELPAIVLLAKRPNEEPLIADLAGDQFVFESVPLGNYEVSPEPAVRGSTQSVRLTDDGQLVELSLALPLPHRIAGRVLDAAGHGVPDAWVRARDASPYAQLRPMSPVLTDAEGAFSLEGILPGRYQLEVSGEGGEARLDGVASNGPAVKLRLLAYGALSGSLTSATGEGVEDFVLLYIRREDGQGSEVRGSRGRWLLPRLTPGTYQLSVHAPDGAAVRTVEVPPGGNVAVDLRVEPFVRSGLR
jgi:protocatechuate 3,4-dioxygenase beta subunit